MRKIILFMAFMMFPALCFAGDVKFAWTKSTSNDVVEYRLYQSETSGAYQFGAKKAVMKTTADKESCTLPNVTDGQKYWVLTAVDGAGNESVPSNEVQLNVDGTSPNAPSGFKILSLTATATVTMEVK